MNTLSLLGVLFIALKLCSVITWSWWFVLIPFYPVFTMVGFTGLLAFLVWWNSKNDN